MLFLVKKNVGPPPYALNLYRFLNFCISQNMSIEHIHKLHLSNSKHTYSFT